MIPTLRTATGIAAAAARLPSVLQSVLQRIFWGLALLIAFGAAHPSWAVEEVRIRLFPIEEIDLSECAKEADGHLHISL